MSDPTFMADPTRLVIAAIVGIALLLALIIKFKLHPVLSMMVSALVIGIGAGMPLDMVADTVTKGVGTTLQNIALLIGLGSMFGQILEESGGAKKIAQTFIDTFGQGHSSWALGITGLVIGTTVFFEAGVVVLIPLAFSVASQTKKSTLYYGIALLAGLAAGYAFVPPSAGSVLVAGTDLLDQLKQAGRTRVRVAKRRLDNDLRLVQILDGPARAQTQRVHLGADGAELAGTRLQLGNQVGCLLLNLCLGLLVHDALLF